VALFALLLSATVHAQDFLSSELSSERTIALIESKDFDSKESTSDSESQTQEHQNWLFHMQGHGDSNIQRRYKIVGGLRDAGFEPATCRRGDRSECKET
jgi:hypothetical protein